MRFRCSQCEASQIASWSLTKRISFSISISSVTPDHWSLIDENEACGTWQDSWDSTPLVCTHPLHVDMTELGGRCGAPVHGSNDADKLDELVDVVGSAPRLELVGGQVIDTAPIRL